MSAASSQDKAGDAALNGAQEISLRELLALGVISAQEHTVLLMADDRFRQVEEETEQEQVCSLNLT